jgi:hypothetical protein
MGRCKVGGTRLAAKDAAKMGNPVGWKYPFPANYSERSASTAFTRAARAAGTAEAITAAPRMTTADATNAALPG